MNKYQNAKLDSYKLVVVGARKNKTATDIIPSFSKGIDKLEAIVTEIDQLKAEQETDITGITDEKVDLQEELIDYVLDVAGAVHSHAQLENNFTLMAKVDFKPASVEKMNQADLISSAETVKAEAIKINSQILAEEGLSVEELEYFSKLIDEFKKIKPAPRVAIIDRATYTQKLKELFTEASKLVKGRLDRLASQYKRKDPTFFIIYKGARNVIYSKPANKSIDEQ